MDRKRHRGIDVGSNQEDVAMGDVVGSLLRRVVDPVLLRSPWNSYSRVYQLVDLRALLVPVSMASILRLRGRRISCSSNRSFSHHVRGLAFK